MPGRGGHSSRRQRAIEAYGNARDRAQTPDAAGEVEEAPLIALAGGLAAGALIAALLPAPRTEERSPTGATGRKEPPESPQAAKDAGQRALDELGLTRDKGTTHPLDSRRRSRGSPRLPPGGRRHCSRQRVTSQARQVLLASRP